MFVIEINLIIPLCIQIQWQHMLYVSLLYTIHMFYLSIQAIVASRLHLLVSLQTYSTSWSNYGGSDLFI